jgi:hypothetical protein
MDSWVPGLACPLSRYRRELFPVRQINVADSEKSLARKRSGMFWKIVSSKIVRSKNF